MGIVKGILGSLGVKSGILMPNSCIIRHSSANTGGIHMTNLSKQVPVPRRNSTKRNRLSPEERRRHQNARRCANQSFKRGRIEKRECFICHSHKKLEFHHPDYAHSLDVICLCQQHHSALSNGRLSLIPEAVKACISVQRAMYALNYKAMMEGIIKRVLRS